MQNIRIDKITSLQNKFIKELVKLKDNKKEILTTGLMLVEGKNVIDIALQNNLVVNILTVNPDRWNNKKVIEVTPEIISKISFLKNSNKDLALIKLPLFQELQFKKIVFLEDIQDPTNLGAIIRSAKSFGFDAIFTTKKSVFKMNSKVISSSQGAALSIPIFQVEAKDFIKKYNYNYYTTDLKANSLPIDKVDFKNPIAIVFGNEGKGISDIWSNIDNKQNFIIPITKFDSLNLAVSASICLYEVNRNNII